MGKLVHAVLFLLCVALSLLPISIVRALTMEMIHRDSIHSPLYPGNLTDEERLQRLYDYSEARLRFYKARYGQQQNLPVTVNTVGNIYFVPHTIGTPARDTYLLIMDTASDVVWLQCEPCRSCWRQKPKPFDPRNSKSFEPISCTHPLCDLRRQGWQCINNQCNYYISYLSGQSSKGVLANETFGFGSDGSQREFVKLVFGCGNQNKGLGRFTGVAGILGLSMRGASMVSQTTSGRFAYCLQPFVSSAQRPSLLRFGHDAELGGSNVKTIRFVPVQNNYNYYLPLVDVSIAADRIGFEPGTFDVHVVSGVPTGGFFIDSGCSVTLFSTGGTYERVRAKLEAYFRAHSLTEVKNPPYDLCYEDKDHKFTAFPSMTLHFENHVDLVVEPEHMVLILKRFFCVAVLSAPKTSTFGAYQQHNYRISYGLVERELSFQPADCTRDG